MVEVWYMKLMHQSNAPISFISLILNQLGSFHRSYIKQKSFVKIVWGST